jgi:hypothetical protein
MSLEAKRFRHVAVAIPEVPVSRGIAASPRQESPQPQHLDIAYRPGKVNGNVGKPVERGL